MESSTKKILLILFFVLISFVLFGCKNNGKIEFYRESAAQSTINHPTEQNQNKDTITKSAGMIIYKDNSSKQNNSNTNIKFGPHDIQFNLPINIK